MKYLRVWATDSLEGPLGRVSCDSCKLLVGQSQLWPAGFALVASLMPFCRLWNF